MKSKLNRTRKVAATAFLICVAAIFLLSALGTVAHAAGLVDDTVSAANEYSKYPLDNYQLDFYVDNSWGWLPWNWLDGIGKQVMYGLYAITNFIWTINLYLSNATGYLVQEAYSLDFISGAADSIGKNMQTLAGVTANGLSGQGFYAGFLLILILIIGIYVAYTGLLKRETTKAIHAVMNLVVVFMLSGAFIAYAPDYIGKINEFSSDISNASLSLGTKIVMPHSESQSKDSIGLIRDSLFSIQVTQPWLLLEFGNSDMDTVGADRAQALLSTSPDENNGQNREEIVRQEIEDMGNTNLTITKTINRLGTAFFLVIFNLGISVFVFLLTGIMIFSQVLFIIFAMFLPMSFILSMIPTFEGMSKRAIMKLFNAILTRAGITLIITMAFSISTMLYTLAADYPFFLIAFLQIVTFAGIYFKLGDLMGMLSLQSGDSHSVGRQIMRKPRMLMQARMHRLQHELGRSISALHSKPATSKKVNDSGSSSGVHRTAQADHARPHGKQDTPPKTGFGSRAGRTVGTIADLKDTVAGAAVQSLEQTRELPTHARYAVYRGKTRVSEGVRDFASSVTQTKTARQEGRRQKSEQRRQTIAERRAEMEQATQKHQPPTARIKSATPIHERVVQPHEPVARSPQASRPSVRTNKPSTEQVHAPKAIPAATEKPVIRADAPPVKAERQIIKPDIAPKPERKVVISDQSEQAAQTGRPIQNSAPDTSLSKVHQQEFIIERKSAAKHESSKKEKISTTTPVPPAQEKGERK